MQGEPRFRLGLVGMKFDLFFENVGFFVIFATINNGIEIVDNVVIASGAVVHKSIFKEGVFAGNPIKKIH